MLERHLQVSAARGFLEVIIQESDPLHDIHMFPFHHPAVLLDTDKFQKLLHQLVQIIRTVADDIQVFFHFAANAARRHDILKRRLDQCKRRLDFMYDIREEIHLFMEQFLLPGSLCRFCYGTFPFHRQIRRIAGKHRHQYDYQADIYQIRCSRLVKNGLHDDCQRMMRLIPDSIPVNAFYTQNILSRRNILIRESRTAVQTVPVVIVTFQHVIQGIGRRRREPQQAHRETEIVLLVSQCHLAYFIDIDLYRLIFTGIHLLSVDIKAGQHYRRHFPVRMEEARIEADYSVVGREPYVAVRGPDRGIAINNLVKQTVSRSIITDFTERH